MPDWAVVVPSNRPDRLTEFVDAWRTTLVGRAHLVVVHDGPRSEAPRVDRATVLSWEDVPDWIPRRSDMIRSLGIYVAASRGFRYGLSLDDDVRPTDGADVLAEYERVFEAGARVSAYLDVGALTTADLPMRGFPLADRERRPVAVQYGGWEGVLDYDGRTQLAGVPADASFAPAAFPVPLGAAVTGCAMNMAWRREYAPIVWQLPLLDGLYNRFGDIWAGLLAKAVCDSERLAVVVNGRARVRHDRASDPARNAEVEAPGLVPNEDRWATLTAVPIRPGATLLETYRKTVGVLALGLPPEYQAHLLRSADLWLELFR